MRVIKSFRELLLLLILLGLALPTIVSAAASTNFQIQEDTFSAGGGIQASSPNYQSRDSIGDIGVGSADSPNYKPQSGYVTTNDPSLTFAVNTSSVALGILTTGTTVTSTATFTVLNYTSYGYVVTINGNPPTNGGHQLTALATPTASSAGTEQFGINLVANTSPTTFGADPVQVPSSSFSFGSAATNYNTTNLYKYVSGNTIAQATKSSGQTNYTISFIANKATTTQGGQYSTSLNLVATGTY